MRKHLFKGRKTWGILLTVSMLLGLMPVLASGAETSQKTEEPLVSILTLSDYQKYDSTGDRFDQLCPQLEDLAASASKEGVSPDYMIFGGDFSCQNSVDYSLQGISQVKTILRNTWSWLTNDKMVLVQGNHDPIQTPGLAKTGPIEYEDFIVYVINNVDYPDKQNIDGSLDIVKNTVADMKAWFDEKIEAGETRPVFIVTHAGLHYDIDRTNGNNQYAYLMFDAINEAATSLDILFFFGHNHTNGDEQVGGSITCYQPGDYLNVCTDSSIAERTGTPMQLEFTYLNYGYVGYVGDITNNKSELVPTDILTITNFLIYEDRIELRRYGYDGEEEAYARTLERYYGDDMRYEVPKEAPPAHTKMLADFTFDVELEDGGFEGGKALATGKYDLVEHEDGYALKLNGSNQFLQLTDLEGKSLLSDITEMTVSFDVYSDGGSSWLFYAAPNTNVQNYSSEKYIGILDRDSTITAERFLSNDNDRPALPSSKLEQKEWKKVTIVYENGETTLYIDGVQAAKEASVVDLETLLGDQSVCYIGKANWGSGEYCTDYIDNYKIYSYAMTGKEVAHKAGVEYHEPTEELTYTAVTDMEEISPDEQYVLAFWRYFGGTDADSTNAYLLQSENKNDLRAATDDGYKTVTYESADGVIPDKALWKLTPVEGGVTLQNVETGSYLGKELAYDSKEPVTYELGMGVCNGFKNYALGIDGSCVRHNRSTSSFILIESTVEKETAQVNACNMTIYKVNEPKQSTDEPIEVVLPYEDVTEADWFYEAVKYTYLEGLMTGMNEKQFGPYGQLSRAQFALMLYRMEGTPEVVTEHSFTDVTGDEWYGPAVLWAAENGIVTGYQSGAFGPADMITREQMAVMMYRYAKYLGQNVVVNSDYEDFEDAASVSGFAGDAVKWAVNKAIITGKNDGTMLDPQGNTARSEAAVIIQRFMSK